MNTPPQQKPLYNIKARHIGPILKLEGLDGNLSKQHQNLIFARNGTGKSFLSRAFRYIAEHKNADNLQSTNNQGNSNSLADLLVSKESKDASAEFVFSHHRTVLAGLEINSQNKNPVPVVDSETIFHVFSQDFVDKELGKPRYEPDFNKITQEITVGSKNIELEEAHEKLKKITKTYDSEYQKLETEFNKEKLSLKSRADIKISLRQYQDISIEKCFIENQQSESSSTDKPLSEIINDFNEVKLIDEDLTLPENLEPLSLNEVPYDKIQEILEKPISPANIAKDIKDKIDNNYDFYETGKELIDKNPEICPLCDQSLENKKTKEIIDAYIKYFEDAEAEAKTLLRDYWKIVNNKIKNVEMHKQNTNNQEKYFNDIKKNIPSQREINLENTNEEYKQIINILTELKDIIQTKGENVSNVCTVPDSNLENICDELNSKLGIINTKHPALINIYKNINKEKKSLRIAACDSFIPWFAEKNKDTIKNIQRIESELKEQTDEIKKLESTGGKVSVRDKVASTLQDLLPYFFDDKYSFDKESYAIKLNGEAMPLRGNSDTLSDGEKSVLAFCYFIAVIHQKVERDSDYKKLFLVFDDPVTSMSYDFVFSVVQALRNLGISKEGDISIKYRQPKEGYNQPRLLILTHNSYFFNIAFSKGHGVVKYNAAFLLDKIDDKKHKISDMSEYIAPFKYQLIDIIGVVNGNEPNHTTANSIRSVLEAIQKFCHPDKDLKIFLEDIAEANKININSTLINTLSHGLYDGTMPPQDDLKKVCKDVKKIAEIFIPGQVNQIKDANKTT